MWVRPLGREDPLEKGMATQASILAWRIPWTQEPGGLQSMESQRVRHDWATEHAHNNVLGNLLETDRDRKPKQTEGVLAFIETEHSPETIYVCSCSNTKCKNLAYTQLNTACFRNCRHKDSTGALLCTLICAWFPLFLSSHPTTLFHPISYAIIPGNLSPPIPTEQVLSYSFEPALHLIRTFLNIPIPSVCDFIVHICFPLSP